MNTMSIKCIKRLRHELNDDNMSKQFKYSKFSGEPFHSVPLNCVVSCSPESPESLESLESLESPESVESVESLESLESSESVESLESPESVETIILVRSTIIILT